MMGRTKGALPPTTSITEEVFNSITHGLGAVAGIVGLILGLLALAAPIRFSVSFILYCACLITLMTVSALYHALTFTRAKRVFQILDHSGIYLLIAGTYTPFVVMLYAGWLEVVMLALIWALAISGIALSVTVPRFMAHFEMGIYISLGWLALIFIPKVGALPAQAVLFVVLGGLLYTVGACVLAIRKSFVHVVWHIFVVVAAVMHFFAIMRIA